MTGMNGAMEAIDGQRAVERILDEEGRVRGARQVGIVLGRLSEAHSSVGFVELESFFGELEGQRFDDEIGVPARGAGGKFV